jgi:hypothetical protein
MPTGQAGYSGRPLAQKLGLKEGHKLLLVGAPPNWYVPDLPDYVEIRRRPGALRAGDLKADIMIAFYDSAAQFAETGPGLAQQLAANSSLWVAWPRRAGGHQSDITDQLLRDVLLPIGVVDVKVAALDQDWSGLKFMWRRENRATRAGA